jgi:peptidyl-prolyl cis-trans isomerase SurA
MEVRENPSFEETKARIERKVSKDSRSKVTKKLTYKRLLAEYNFKDLSKNLKFVYPLVDSSFFTKDWKCEVGSKGKKKLFILAGQDHTVNDFVSYLDLYNGKRKRGDLKVVTYKLYEKWKEESTFNYEKTQLASKYPEYGRLLNEYKNGILLFDLMEQKVWNKAINDTTGLEQFFESNQEDYMWSERVDAEIFTCDNDSTAKALVVLLENKASVPMVLDKLNINSALKVRVGHGVYEKKDEEVLSMIDWKLGVSKKVNLNDKVYVVNIAQLLDKGPQKINDSRGLIIADYQTHLDKEWVKVLREKYTYSINKESYNSLFE